ncbi:hypothetical protein EC845_0717 [Comamonas sp. BIGb0124]|uniref:hypothetical protein n=1 Tax=Comamonas sp. BIGb0124 TaxID=2485130 RepID=UPI000F4617A6|nr:hypothetical protein [Comamonas sp. BIGb0124]ROR24691.1 hypothetical protein EC845_0717 [Comamonas sp. BIGb0124]
MTLYVNRLDRSRSEPPHRHPVRDRPFLLLGYRTIAAPVRLAAQGAGKALGLPVAFAQTGSEATERASRLLAHLGRIFSA